MLSFRTRHADLPLAYARAVFGRLLYAALIVALIALAAALVAAVAPRALGYGTFAVHGGSMGESIPNGSLVYTRSLPAGDVKIGDVILVREESAALPKVHRVVAIYPEGDHVAVRTKGDANQTLDPDLYVLPDRVATPTRTVPYLGYLLGLVVTPLGGSLLVALPTTLLCLFALRAIWAPQRRTTPEPGVP